MSFHKLCCKDEWIIPSLFLCACGDGVETGSSVAGKNSSLQPEVPRVQFAKSSELVSWVVTMFKFVELQFYLNQFGGTKD